MPRHELRTLIDLVEEQARQRPEQAAFYWEDQPVSYDALWRGVNRFATRLGQFGVVRGDRILIGLPNGPDFFAAFYGAIRAGAIAVPAFPASGPERLAALARLCGATLLVVPGATSTVVDGVRSLTVADSDDCGSDGVFPDIDPSDIAFLQYTSGSTGMPKGVMLSHHGLLTNIRQLIAGMAITSSDCFVSWLPAYHDMGLILMTMVPFFLGAKLVLLPTSLANARPWLVAITRHRGTLTAAPDFAYRLALRYVRDPSVYDLTSLRVALNAAEPVRPTTLAGFEQAFGLHNVLIAGYGLAEATVGVCTWTPGVAPLVDARGVVSVGGAFNDVDIQILDNDAPAAAGVVGDIVIQSPANTRGYFSDAAETSALFWRETYVRTGDLGYLDEDRHLFITGRRKNIIKHGGETIFPQEAEQITDSVPGVRRSAAVGIDAGGPEGEQLYVFAEVSKPAGLDERELQETVISVVQAIHAQLGIRPARVYLLKPRGIPLTHNGKTRHAELRDTHESGALRASGVILFPGY